MGQWRSPNRCEAAIPWSGPAAASMARAAPSCPIVYRMYLKRLEILGFKTFALKTEIAFPPGVTAVLGPNGSGKSNVADAILWVLGEQNVRSLRGNVNQDVIFAGTEGR